MNIANRNLNLLLVCPVPYRECNATQAAARG